MKNLARPKVRKNRPKGVQITDSAPSPETFLRRAFAVAKRARTNGNHPFGAILVGEKAAVLF
jgi:hypothetical protein